MTTISYPKKELDPITTGFTASAIVTIILSMVLTIVKESYPPLLSLMKSISVLGVKHHWLVHGLMIVALFYLCGWLFSRSSRIQNIQGRRLANTLVWATIIGSLSIFGFYFMELFK